MALGSLLIRLLGMRVRHQALFERMLKAGATGLGYGDPAMGRRSQHLEHTALRHCAARWAGTSPVIFDVGANRGQYIGLVRELAGDLKPRIHAFEPNPTLAGALQQAHGADPLVQVHALGLSAAPGSATFTQYRQDDLSSLHAAGDHPSNYRRMEVERTFEVPLTTVDAHCAAHNIERIHLLKIDTEGHDLHVLQGARGMLERGAIDHVQFEFSEMNLLSRTTFFDHWKLLHPQFTVNRLCRDGLYPIRAYEPVLHEVYHVANFFAVRNA